MNALEVVSRLKSSSLGVTVHEESDAWKSKQDVIFKIPLASYVSFCKECKDGLFFPNPRLIFIALNSVNDLVVRIDEGHTATGVLFTVLLKDKQDAPSVANFWPVARWYEREIAAKHGINFDFPRTDEIELVFPERNPQ